MSNMSTDSSGMIFNMESVQVCTGGASSPGRVRLDANAYMNHRNSIDAIELVKPGRGYTTRVSNTITNQASRAYPP